MLCCFGTTVVVHSSQHHCVLPYIYFLEKVEKIGNLTFEKRMAYYSFKMQLGITVKNVL